VVRGAGVSVFISVAAHKKLPCPSAHSFEYVDKPVMARSA